MTSESRELQKNIIEDGLDVIEFKKILVEVREKNHALRYRGSWTWKPSKYSAEKALQFSLRFQVLIPKLRVYAKYFDFSMLPDTDLAILLCFDWRAFELYIDFMSLNIDLRVQIVRAHPALFSMLLGNSSITRDQFSELIFTEPSIAKMSTKVPYAGLFLMSWESLLASDRDTYSQIMLQELPNMRSKTYVRKILLLCPEIILLLSIADIQQTVLSEREWVLCAHSMYLKFSKSVLFWIVNEITMQIVAGTCKSTVPLRGAINYAKTS